MACFVVRVNVKRQEEDDPREEHDRQKFPDAAIQDVRPGFVQDQRAKETQQLDVRD